jgi:hypothetical protein
MRLAIACGVGCVLGAVDVVEWRWVVISFWQRVSAGCSRSECAAGEPDVYGVLCTVYCVVKDGPTSDEEN